MNRIPKLLSKTKLMRGFRCLKAMYLTIHRKDLEPPITPELQALFDQGNKVGELARTYFPGGELINNVPWDFIGAVNNTRILLENNTKTVYEAAFEYAGCYARVDVLEFNEKTKKFNIYEVKSTTKVKPDHIHDVGLQTWILAKSGLPIEGIHIVHLNTECRYPDLSNLFTIVDVTQEMRDNYLNIQPRVAEIFKTIREPNVPDVDIGPYCVTPTDCPFKAHCWEEKKVPELSVLNMPGMHQRKWELYQNGILNIDDTRLDDLTELQQRIVNSHKTGERYLDRTGIQKALEDFTFPLIFLDFETINPAIPRYDGTSPYKQVPFQFSAHIWPAKNKKIKHVAYLHTDASDPRPKLIPELLKACGKKGSIVAYYGKFEADRIKEMAAFSPKHHDALLALNERIVDPLPILKDNVYDPAFCGSFSLKKTAPGLLGEGQSYDDMDVANGGDAQRAFELLISKTLEPEDEKKLEKAMLDYCEKDTWVMVELVKWLMAEGE